MKTLQPTDFAVFCLVIKDDFFLYDMMKRQVDEGVRDFYFATPDEYWAGSKTPAADIEEIGTIANKLRADGCRVRHRIINVSKYRPFSRKRIGLETMVRNEVLSWIRYDNFDHVLVVDGDELWRTGLLQRLIKQVQLEKPTFGRCGVVPVVGSPGYPVRNAMDRMTIYIKSNLEFIEGRNVPGTPCELLEYGIIHFTATRKSLDEIVSKMRESGHYDDPSYDFEGFIKNTLPHVKGGSKNLHMYTAIQIWPEAGAWSQVEMDDIPGSIRTQLSKEIGPEFQGIPIALK